MHNSNVVNGTPGTVALVLAGGRGKRLAPLTDHRAKPATPFGGQYRLIDFVLSNLAHSGIRDVWVVEQFRPDELNRHLAGGRPWDLDGTRHGLRQLPPFEGGTRDGFAEGNAHALYQQLPKIVDSGADTVVVTSADQIYRLDLRPVLERHRASGAGLTIVTTRVDHDPSRYGVVRPGPDGTVAGFDYKPEHPDGDVVATEVFVYDAAELAGALTELAAATAGDDDGGGGPGDDGGAPDGSALGDYGEHLVPYFVERGRAREHRLDGYWLDVGTLEAFHQGHVDLLEGRGIDPGDPDWPVLTNPRHLPPTRIGPDARVTGSLVPAGCRIDGTVERSVLGPGTVVEAGAHVADSVLLGDNTVRSGAVVRRTIADTGAELGPGDASGDDGGGPAVVPSPSGGGRR